MKKTTVAQALLETLLNPTDSPHALPSVGPKQTYVNLTVDAWEALQRAMTYHAYKGRGPGQGTGAYLEALLTANPAPSNWRDTRPEDLRNSDLARLQAGLLPLWFEDNVRHIQVKADQRSIRTDVFARIAPTLVSLSDHFGIKSRTQSNTRSDANCVLEAIGLKHLTPVNNPPRCAYEKNMTRAIWYETQKRNKEREISW